MSVIAVDDFSYPEGWNDLRRSEERARWYCSQLEDGQVLFLKGIPFDLPQARDREEEQHALGPGRPEQRQDRGDAPARSRGR